MTGIKCPNCGHDLEFTPEGAFVCAACGKIYRASRSASAPAKAQNTEAKAEEHAATAAENAPAENENAADTLVFRYTKDGSHSYGSDCGYVYTMEFTAV